MVTNLGMLFKDGQPGVAGLAPRQLAQLIRHALAESGFQLTDEQAVRREERALLVVEAANAPSGQERDERFDHPDGRHALPRRRQDARATSKHGHRRA